MSESNRFNAGREEMNSREDKAAFNALVNKHMPLPKLYMACQICGDIVSIDERGNHMIHEHLEVLQNELL